MSQPRIEVYSDELQCPQCGAFELKDKDTLNIRAFKVYDAKGIAHSQCLVCLEAGKPNKGWFCTEFLD